MNPKTVLDEPDENVRADDKGNVVGWVAVATQSQRRKVALATSIQQADDLRAELSDETMARYVEMQGGQAVHRLWHNEMRDQGRDIFGRDDWKTLATRDQVLDRAIARGLLLDFLGHVSARVSGSAALRGSGETDSE